MSHVNILRYNSHECHSSTPENLQNMLKPTFDSDKESGKEMRCDLDGANNRSETEAAHSSAPCPSRRRDETGQDAWAVSICWDEYGYL